MLFEPFEAPKLKLERARYHISALERDVVAFLGRKPFRAVIEADSTPGRLRIAYRVSEPVPKILSTMIGDAIHNLRAALDLMACDLVRLNSQSDEDVYFPFCRDATLLDETIKKRHLDRAAPNVVHAIKSLKPYKGGNVQLRAIHDLDIMDKHQAIIPLGDCAAFDGLPPETGIVVT